MCVLAQDDLDSAGVVEEGVVAIRLLEYFYRGVFEDVVLKTTISDSVKSEILQKTFRINMV